MTSLGLDEVAAEAPAPKRPRFDTPHLSPDGTDKETSIEKKVDVPVADVSSDTFEDPKPHMTPLREQVTSDDVNLTDAVPTDVVPPSEPAVALFPQHGESSGIISAADVFGEEEENKGNPPAVSLLSQHGESSEIISAADVLGEAEQNKDNSPAIAQIQNDIVVQVPISRTTTDGHVAPIADAQIEPLYLPHEESIESVPVLDTQMNEEDTGETREESDQVLKVDAEGPSVVDTTVEEAIVELQTGDEHAARNILGEDVDMTDMAAVEPLVPPTTINTDAIPASVKSPVADLTSQNDQSSCLLSSLEASLDVAQRTHQLSNTASETIAAAAPHALDICQPTPGANAADDHPEWEVDSSPLESSSDSTSDDSSSEVDSDEEENAYKLLSPEEQARILMEGDGGSDDEGGGKAGQGSAGHLRTKNEIYEEVIPKPNVILTPEMRVAELGFVEGIVENTVLVKANVSGEYRVLDSGSVLCLDDRSVIGDVYETLGQVQQPFYSVRFTNMSEIAEAGLTIGTKIFYSEQHSLYVFTQALKAFKGSDASNLHDEEVGAEEIEFSDDEAEAEHKRQLKQKRLEKRGGRAQQNGGHSHAHPLRQESKAYDPSLGINYDDVEEDGPYKPLTRPAGYGEQVGRPEAPQEGETPIRRSPITSNQYVHRGRGRGRGRNYRGRGDGRGRGQSHGPVQQIEPNGYSLPPNGARYQPSPIPAPLSNNYPITPQSTSALSSFNGHYSNVSPAGQYSPHQPNLWPSYSQQPHYQIPQASQAQNQQPWQTPPPTSLPAGAYLNPPPFQGVPPNFPI